MPLVSGKRLIDFLELEFGWRYAEHSQTGGDNTYKIALAYFPNPDIQVRVSYKVMRARQLTSCLVTPRLPVLRTIPAQMVLKKDPV